MKIQRKIQLAVPAGQKKLRIDKYLALHIQNSSRTKIRKAIDEKCVLVNTKSVKANYEVNPGDKIEITLPHLEEKPEVLPENIPLEIIFEDNNLLVVNKPAGMVTHPAYKNYSGTLVNALLYYMQNSSSTLSSLNGFERAGIVHRLDKNTSGLLVIAKDEETHRRLSKLFMYHNIEREYWAIVWGHFHNKKGIIEKSLGRSQKDRKKVVVRSDGRNAVTEYEVLREFEFLSLVKLILRTGRTHQIRVHMHSIGHPVFGDPEYGGRKPHSLKPAGNAHTRSLRDDTIKQLLNLMPRQSLHAKVLGFIHPLTGEHKRFESELPCDMKELIEKLNGE